MSKTMGKEKLSKLYMGNVNPNVTESELREFIVDFKINESNITGIFLKKGYAFIDCLDQSTADAMIDKIHEQEFQGKKLSLDPSLTSGVNQGIRARVAAGVSIQSKSLEWNMNPNMDTERVVTIGGSIERMSNAESLISSKLRADIPGFPTSDSPQGGSEGESDEEDVYFSCNSSFNESKTSFLEAENERQKQIKEHQAKLNILRNESTICKDLDERLRRSLTLTNIIELVPQEEKKPEITEEMYRIIDRARNSYNQKQILRKTPNNIDIVVADIKSLGPQQWLNDNVINSYLDMIALRSREDTALPSVYVFTTFFYPKYLKEGYSNILKRWTRKVDIFSYKLLIFPIHLGVHWCLAVIDMRIKTIKYFDSMGEQNFKCAKALLEYLSQEYRERKKQELNKYDWKTEIVEDIPQQQNGSDCGMFACKFAEHLSRDAKITFTQDDMNYYRERMIYEIIEQHLLYP